jgi:hypothetical protein
VSSDATDDDLGPGLHVLREAEPLKRAGVLAARLDADLCATLPQAEAALEARSQLPLVDVTTLSTLEVLARRIARAERIAARTRERAVDEVGQRLAGDGAGLAVHPTTIRDRAAAVATARAAHAAAEQELAAHLAANAEWDDLPADQASAAVTSPRPEPAAAPATVGASLHVRRSRAVGAIVAALGVGLVLFAVDAAPLWAALLPALAAALWAMRYLAPSDSNDDDVQARATTSSFLAEVGASTDELFGARRAARDAEEQTALLTSRRDRAQEDVRVAERAWHDLAGADTDVDAVDDVVRRFDPQHEDARLLAAETVGVRAADVVLHHFQQRWLAFWRELGRDAPTAAAGEAAVQALEEQVRRPVVLVGPATPLGADLARVAPAAAVIVLEGPAGDET